MGNLLNGKSSGTRTKNTRLNCATKHQVRAWATGNRAYQDRIQAEVCLRDTSGIKGKYHQQKGSQHKVAIIYMLDGEEVGRTEVAGRNVDEKGWWKGQDCEWVQAPDFLINAPGRWDVHFTSEATPCALPDDSDATFLGYVNAVEPDSDDAKEGTATDDVSEYITGIPNDYTILGGLILCGVLISRLIRR